LKHSSWNESLPWRSPNPGPGAETAPHSLSTMPIGVLTLELYIPHAHSLKEKRMVVRSLKERLRARFNVAVAELDHQDLWQRSLIGVVSISGDPKALETLLEAVQRESEALLGDDLVGIQLECF
jgi:uncharacterized protein